MCNACGFLCCASDSFQGCGCDCEYAECREDRCAWCGQMVDFALWAGEHENGLCVAEGSGYE